MTDHRALSWLFNNKDPGSRLTRRRLKLAEYEIHFKPGVNNINADALSRVRTVTTRAQAKRDTQQASQGAENPVSLQFLDNRDTLDNHIAANKENHGKL